MVALRLWPPHVIAVLSRTLQSTSQLPIRLSMLLLGGLVVLADLVGAGILSVLLFPLFALTLRQRAA